MRFFAETLSSGNSVSGGGVVFFAVNLRKEVLFVKLRKIRSANVVRDPFSGFPEKNGGRFRPPFTKT